MGLDGSWFTMASDEREACCLEIPQLWNDAAIRRLARRMEPLSMQTVQMSHLREREFRYCCCSSPCCEFSLDAAISGVVQTCVLLHVHGKCSDI